MDLRDAVIDWDESDEEGSNTSHIAEHGLTPDEVESVLVGKHDIRCERCLGPTYRLWNNEHGPIYCHRVRGAEPGRPARDPPDHRL